MCHTTELGPVLRYFNLSGKVDPVTKQPSEPKTLDGHVPGSGHSAAPHARLGTNRHDGGGPSWTGMAYPGFVNLMRQAGQCR